MLLGELLKVGSKDGKLVGTIDMVGRIDGAPCGAVLRDGTDVGRTLGLDEIVGFREGSLLCMTVGSDDGTEDGTDDGDTVGCADTEGDKLGSDEGCADTEGDRLGSDEGSLDNEGFDEGSALG